MSVGTTIPASDQGDYQWQKAAASQGFGMCVEMANVDDENVAVRHSANEDDDAIVIPKSVLAGLFESIRNGEMDHLL